MSANWTKSTITGSTGTPNLIADTSQPPVLSSSYVKFGTGTVINASLGETLTTDFSLSLQANITNNASRILWVALLNETGTQGYGFTWISGNGTGNGTVKINKFPNINPATDLVWNAPDTSGTSPASRDSGYALSNASFASITLAWNASDGKLTLSVGGTSTKLETTDTDFASFSKIYIGGNNHVAFDSLSVTGTLSNVPEPSTTAIFAALPAIGFAGWRRFHRKQNRS